jgi:hypothetical protein
MSSTKIVISNFSNILSDLTCTQPKTKSCGRLPAHLPHKTGKVKTLTTTYITLENTTLATKPKTQKI